MVEIAEEAEDWEGMVEALGNLADVVQETEERLGASERALADVQTEAAGAAAHSEELEQAELRHEQYEKQAEERIEKHGDFG